MNSYMEDCIHLKACRRLCKKVRAKYFGMQIARGCNSECSAYESRSDYYTYEQVKAVMHGACNDGRNGFDAGDCLVSDYL